MFIVYRVTVHKSISCEIRCMIGCVSKYILVKCDTLYYLIKFNQECNPLETIIKFYSNSYGYLKIKNKMFQFHCL